MAVSVPENSSPCYLETEAHKKPQTLFQCILADNSYNQFQHLIHEGGDSENAHPYKEEIEGLLKNLKTEFVELFDGKVTKIEGTECVWVDTMSQLEELADVLSKERVFGVDTEQHDFRSFLGFTCLIQISTTTKDYLVDAIALHDVMGVLRPVFADPRICKVFHGANNDILWLQRDFHIYVVNLFDTAKASEVLWKQGTKSFAYLIEKYAKVSKNKALQRGDWRPRPLSAEQLQYARTDSHYLLPVAHSLVSELKNNSIDLVLDTIRRSNVLCLELYTKKVYLGAASIISRLENPESFHYNVCDTTLPCSCLSKFGRIVRRLCAWREIMARVHDESLSFILSDPAIGEIAASLPTTETDLHSTICTADKSMHTSPVVSNNLEDFGRLILLDSSTEDDDDFGRTILQSKGNCPLSLYNRNLLSGTIPKVLQSNRPVLDPCAKRKKSGKSEKLGLVYDSEWQLLWEGSQSLAKAHRNRYNGKLVSHGCDTVTILPSHEECNRQKVCVGCNKSSKNKLKLYQIIPHCYEEWFPVRSSYYKETKLVCEDCYAIVDAAATQCKQQIAKEFGIILGLVEASPEVRGCAFTLLQSGGRVPRNRLEEMTKTINMYDEGREVKMKDLEQAAVAELRMMEKKHKVYSEVVSRKIKKKHEEGGFESYFEAVRKIKKNQEEGGFESMTKQPLVLEDKKPSHPLFFFEDKKPSPSECNHKSKWLASSSEFNASSSECEECRQEMEWFEHGKLLVNYIYASKCKGKQRLFIFWERWKQVFTSAFDRA